jgi:hypothetical protein
MPLASVSRPARFQPTSPSVAFYEATETPTLNSAPEAAMSAMRTGPPTSMHMSATPLTSAAPATTYSQLSFHQLPEEEGSCATYSAMPKPR